MSTPKFSRLDPAQRREQILDAANALFAERAYDEVSIEDIASAAGVTRGLVHHYFGGRNDVYIGLLERLGAQREEQLRPPAGRSARARLADTVSRWLDWTEANRTIWLATIAHGEDIADPTSGASSQTSCAAPSRCSRPFTPTSPRTRRGCATRSSAGPALNRAATRRWLHGEATREATHEAARARRSSTSCARSALDPHQVSADLFRQMRTNELQEPRLRRRRESGARSSGGGTRTHNDSVNSRAFCRLNYPRPVY